MDNILSFTFSRKNRLYEEAEPLKYEYVKNAAKLKNSFNTDFYTLSAEFAFTDAVSCFVEIDCFSNIFYKKFPEMSIQSWQRFFKIMAMYDTIKICMQRKKDLQCGKMKEDMFFVYGFDETEIKLFNILEDIAFKYESKFSAIFPRVMLKYVLGKDISDSLIIAFTENICYNSFNEFMKYFSRYITVSRRIKLAKQA